ncbi:MAG: sulfotransferase domain-containing protein [Marmoricola sp.]
MIGTKRGGTTSFYFDLIEHPSIVRLFPPPVPGLKPHATKGVHYFDTNYDRGERWYRSYMPTAANRNQSSRKHGVPAMAGEASPYYLFHPDAARRAHACVPDARLIVLLRDPAQRTYSHWKERRRAEAEELGFLAALDAEPARLAGERDRLLADPSYVSYSWEQQSYATQSRYADSLRPWIARYGRDSLLVLASEDYYADPVQTLGDADEFLGLPRRTTSTGTIRNAATGEPLPSGVRERLAAEFSDDVRALAALTGRAFPWA